MIELALEIEFDQTRATGNVTMGLQTIVARRVEGALVTVLVGEVGEDGLILSVIQTGRAGGRDALLDAAARVPGLNEGVDDGLVGGIEPDGGAIAVEVRGVVVRVGLVEVGVHARMGPAAHAVRAARGPEPAVVAHELGRVSEEVGRDQVAGVQPHQHAAVLLRGFAHDPGLPAVLARVDRDVPEPRVPKVVERDQLVDQAVRLELVQHRQLGPVHANVVDDDAREFRRVQGRAQLVERVQKVFERTQVVGAGCGDNRIRITFFLCRRRRCRRRWVDLVADVFLIYGLEVLVSTEIRRAVG